MSTTNDRSPSTWATTSATSTSTSSSARGSSTASTRLPTGPAGRAARCTSPSSTPTAPAGGLPLVWGQNGLTPENGFADQGEVLIKCRQAADRLGATMMDRPSGARCTRSPREVYMTLTNNSRRGNTPVSSNNVDGTTQRRQRQPGSGRSQPASRQRLWPHHPLARRWNARDATTFRVGTLREVRRQGDDQDAGRQPTPGDRGQPYGYVGNINGDDYGAPDGLWFDKDGRLWIETDQAGDATGDWVNIGGNMMLCADPSTGETRRFLTSPTNCEVTGVVSTPGRQDHVRWHPAPGRRLALAASPATPPGRTVASTVAPPTAGGAPSTNPVRLSW